MDFFSLVILFLLISSTLQPLLQARYLAMQRGRVWQISGSSSVCANGTGRPISHPRSRKRHEAGELLIRIALRH